MENKPIISFISPNYNRAKFIAETLDSLLEQSDPRWENIIVDDGSTDESIEIIKAYCQKDTRFRFFQRDREPKGACSCRNIGVAKAHGRYVVFLDTDDLAEPHCVEQRLREMEAHSDLDFGIFLAQKFEYTPGDMQVWWNVDKPSTDELFRLFKQDAICQGTGPAFRKESFLRVGQWDESLSLWQDIDLFFRLYIQGYRYKKFFDLPSDVQIREFPGSISRSSFFATHKMESRFRVIRRAVSLLCDNGLTYLAPKAKYMTAELVTGAARSGQYEMAKKVWRWAISTDVLTAKEVRVLRQYSWVSRLRLTEFSLINKALQWKLRGLRCEESTMGKISVSKFPIITA